MGRPLQIRRDTSEKWTSVNPVLAQGELGVDLTLKATKVGDGVTAWSSLPYSGRIHNTASKSSAYTVLLTDDIIALLTTTAGAGFTITLPSATTLGGKTYTVTDVQYNAHNRNVTVAVPSGEKLNSVTNGTYVINIPGETLTITSLGSLGWFIT